MAYTKKNPKTGAKHTTFGSKGKCSTAGYVLKKDGPGAHRSKAAGRLAGYCKKKKRAA